MSSMYDISSLRNYTRKFCNTDQFLEIALFVSRSVSNFL